MAGSDNFVYKWSNEETRTFIRRRVVLDSLFTGKRNASKSGWETVIKELGLEAKVTQQQVAKKWENLKKKYKELKSPPTGTGTEEGEATAATWPFYEAMDEALGARPSICPPSLVASLDEEPGPSGSGEPEQPSQQRSKRKSSAILDFLREDVEREERRERAAAERSERLLSLFEKLIEKL